MAPRKNRSEPETEPSDSEEESSPSKERSFTRTMHTYLDRIERCEWSPQSGYGTSWLSTPSDSNYTLFEKFLTNYKTALRVTNVDFDEKFSRTEDSRLNKSYAVELIRRVVDKSETVNWLDYMDDYDAATSPKDAIHILITRFLLAPVDIIAGHYQLVKNTPDNDPRDRLSHLSRVRRFRQTFPFWTEVEGELADLIVSSPWKRYQIWAVHYLIWYLREEARTGVRPLGRSMTDEEREAYGQRVMADLDRLPTSHRQMLEVKKLEMKFEERLAQHRNESDRQSDDESDNGEQPSKTPITESDDESDYDEQLIRTPITQSDDESDNDEQPTKKPRTDEDPMGAES
ncbi:hypothetical protein DICA2_C00694 [Diutina catenulata]